MQLKNLLLIILIVILTYSCARRASPSGGDKDESAPILVSTFPAYGTTDFDKKEIKIYFDEYIKLKDLRKHLVVSPPLKYAPIITPLGIPSKKIKIIIQDTLIDNTTYTFNFGESIVDNSEGNILSNFKYIFSTGSYLDSLKINGQIKDAFYNKPEKSVSILLYLANDKFNDSTIYKEKPLYVASTLDSISWEISNIKKGKYHLLALKDANNDFIYQPKGEKIAFLDTIVSVPTDQPFLLNLFKESALFSISKPKEIAKGHLVFGFYGDGTDFTVKTVDKKLKYKSYLDKKTDSLHVFYNSKNKLDSLQFQLTNKLFSELKTVKLRSSTIDSLIMTSNARNILHPNDTIRLYLNSPIESIDKEKISLIDKDSIPVSFIVNNKNNFLKIIFKKKESQRYKLELMPNSITDFFDQTNDTIKYNFTTKKLDYYGSITMDMKNVNTQVIIQLLNKKKKIIQKKIIKKSQKVAFEYLIPGDYIVKVIFDKNENNKWDSGNYFRKIQPEKIHFFNKTINVKENWFVNESMELQP